MNPATHTNSVTEQKLKQLKSILFLLQENLEELKNEVDRSYDLLKIGEVTDFAKKIDDSISNPMTSFNEISSNIDNQVKHFIDILVKSFFKDNSEIVHRLLRNKTTFDDLHYSIVLKEDTTENRGKIFEFLEKFDLNEISNRYPVYFQFVPIELMSNLVNSEEIKLD